MKEKLNGKCPFQQGENGMRCFTTRALPVARDYIVRELEERVSMMDVPDLLCNASDSKGCPVRSELERFGAGSIYARPILGS